MIIRDTRAYQYKTTNHEFVNSKDIQRKIHAQTWPIKTNIIHNRFHLKNAVNLDLKCHNIAQDIASHSNKDVFSSKVTQIMILSML